MKDKMTAKSGRMQQASLLRTLARVTGWPYLALGGIKLINDALNFSGVPPSPLPSSDLKDLPSFLPSCTLHSDSGLGLRDLEVERQHIWLLLLMC